MNLKIISLFLLLLSLLISCKNDKKEEKVVNTSTIKKVDTIKNDNNLIEIKDTITTTEVIDSVKKDLQLGIKINSLEDKNLYVTSNKENYTTEDYVLNASLQYETESRDEKFLKIPYIVKHDGNPFLFNKESYPEEGLRLRTIPNKLDTLDIFITNDECNECLIIYKIQNKTKDLYYKIFTLEIDANNYKTIASKGNLDSLLVKRNLTKEDIYITETAEHNSKAKIIDDWKEKTELSEKLNKEYKFSYDLNLKKKPNLAKIKSEIDKLNIKFNSLDSLKFIYKKYINSNDRVTIDNFLTNEDKYSYFHSGSIYCKDKGEYMAFIESIDITYISKNNDLFKVRWLENYSETTGSGPLDDNYVVFKNGIYGINDWTNKRMISLFHPDMKEDDYLVVYELKLKYLDTYIHSPVKIINYQVPNSN